MVLKLELRIIIISGTARIIICTMPTTIIGILLANTNDTMRAAMFIASTVSTIVRNVLWRTRTRFRRV